MSHYAKIVDGKVVDVIVAEQNVIQTRSGTWVQTSYNTKGNVHYGEDGKEDGVTPLRGNYAGIGYVYDSTNDVFYEPQPFPSWTLGTNTWLWNSPIPHPDDGNYYNWDEDLYQSDNTKGWVLIG